MFIIGDVRVVDLGLEVELGRFERVVGRQDEEELKFAALVGIVSIRSIVEQEVRRGSRHMESLLGHLGRCAICAHPLHP